jgi:hypothetical protein
MMLWLELMALPDGARVESGIATSEEDTAGSDGNSYRLHCPDGTTREFSSTITLMEHLLQTYRPDELTCASTEHLGTPR